MVTSPQETPQEKRIRYNRILIGIGLFLLFCNMVYASRIIMLDLIGKRTQGTLLVEEYGCSNRGRNTKCQIARVEYSTNFGTLTFDAGLTPIFWNMFTTIGDESATHLYPVQVRYFGFWPYMAKMSLPFHIEYLDPLSDRSLCGSFSIWPPVIIGIGYLTMRRNMKKKEGKEPQPGNVL